MQQAVLDPGTLDCQVVGEPEAALEGAAGDAAMNVVRAFRPPPVEPCR